MKLETHALTAERWPDLESLFGPRGACAGCWCMWWRLDAKVWEAQRGAANRKALRKLATAGAPLGLIGYLAGAPVAWCAVAPRESFPRLEKSRALKRPDDKPVWSVTCLFVARPHRRKGVSTAMLRAAAAWVKSRGGRVIEGYPVEPRKEIPAAFAWTGTAAAFAQAGFIEVARPLSRPIVRRKAG